MVFGQEEVLRSDQPMRALVADDHPMCRQAEASALIAALRDMGAQPCQVDEAATLSDAIGLARDAWIILLDLGLPDGQGMAGLLAITGAALRARVIVVTGNETPGLGALVRAAGGHGLVPKSAPMTTLIDAIHAVIDGGTWFVRDDYSAQARSLSQVTARMATLSVAERRVLGAMCDGSLNKQIAFRFGLSEVTVKQHVKAVLRKLGAVNRTQAAMQMQFLDHAAQPPEHIPA